MGWGRDLAYAATATVAAPVWIPLLVARGWHRNDWRSRDGKVSVPDANGAARVLVHAVSVGEVSSVSLLVPALQEQGFDCVVSATTDTGIQRARDLFSNTPVVRFPLDWTRSVGRFLDRVKPDVVALVELEVWPNFVEACEERGIRVVVVGGRMSDRSAPRYARLSPLLRGSFARLSAVGAQTDAYADRFVQMGTPADRVTVTDSLKWDAVELRSKAQGPLPGAEQLQADLGIDATRPLVVAGSTGPGEESRLLTSWPSDVQLLLAPRRPERFDEVAKLMPGAVRRSYSHQPGPAGTHLFLLDTVGELALAYSLADVAIVGRSFNGMGGSNPIEPAALGCATLIGPDHRNFRSQVSALADRGGVVVAEPDQIRSAALQLARNPAACEELVRQAHQAITEHRGATKRTAALIERTLAGPDAS